jgi:hypothetical protein
LRGEEQDPNVVPEQYRRKWWATVMASTYSEDREPRTQDSPKQKFKIVIDKDVTA